jgi:methionyl-tRNA formyltransferase
MRVILFGNNRIASNVASCIREHGDDIVGVVLHPPHCRKFGDEIIASSQSSPDTVFDASQLSSLGTLERIAALRPEIGVSAFFGHILRPAVLDLFPERCINLHPALLPYNRGSYPNVWSIVEGTPAGATLHYIDPGVDTGDIIAQCEVPVDATDTGETLYRKLENACVELFRETWPLVRSGNVPCRSQRGVDGSIHRVTDVQKIDEIHLDGVYSARHLLDVIRARTFSGCSGAYFVEKGQKIYLRLQLIEEGEPSSE